MIRLGAAAISDALGKRGAMDHDMQCRSANPAMAGPAFTVRVHTADILMISRALSDCPKGHVLVIDAQGELNTAVWGELTTYRAHYKGLAGVVIDGALRDAAKIAQSPLPVYARAVVPNGGGAEYLGEINVTVSCGGQVVHPGDWLIGDRDGVVVIPAALLDETLALAARIVKAEKALERAILKGADLGTLLHVAEKIERKRGEIFIPQLGAETPDKP
ncbi:MAG: RraA family protein [Bryobacteraceae bacterium]|nr:RraA family protein [Bryobacteraceae bacterium]